MNVIDVLEERGLVDAVTSDGLRKLAEAPLKAYVGFDPTADSLHLGNLVGIVVLRWMQKFGHTPVVILGGATGRIGDPSGKSAERPLLDEPTIVHNVRKIRVQFEQVLDFFNVQAKPLVLNNNDWFSSITLIEFLRDIGKHFRVGPMLAKEMVRSRIESEEGISFTEFSYQMIQGYDFYHLFKEHGVVLQMGGSDQWGNITSGIELTRKLSGKPVYGLTWPLLTRSDGKKFGKSEEGAIWLSSDKCSPYQLYQYLYRVLDADVIKMLKMLTFVSMDEIRQLEGAMQRPDYVPNTAQKKLAEEITRMLHGNDGLAAALRATEAAAPGKSGELDPETFQQTLKHMPHISLALLEVVEQKFVDLSVRAGLFASKGEAVRMIQQGGAYLNNEKVEDPQLKLLTTHLIGGRFLLLAAGKKKKVVVDVLPV